MMTELKDLKNKKETVGKTESDEIKVKLKKSQEVVKVKSKAIDEMEAKVNNLNVKLGEEVSKRANAEAEMV